MKEKFTHTGTMRKYKNRIPTGEFFHVPAMETEKFWITTCGEYRKTDGLGVDKNWILDLESIKLKENHERKNYNRHTGGI